MTATEVDSTAVAEEPKKPVFRNRVSVAQLRRQMTVNREHSGRGNRKVYPQSRQVMADLDGDIMDQPGMERLSKEDLDILQNGSDALHKIDILRKLPTTIPVKKYIRLAFSSHPIGSKTVRVLLNRGKFRSLL